MAANITLSAVHSSAPESHIIDVFEELARETLRQRNTERLIIAGFNARGVIIHWVERDGASDHILLDMEYLGAILSDPGCHYIALAHNHPSGCPRPSRADMHTTRYIADFCNETGAKLVEHIIIGRRENHSIFRDSPA